MKDIIKKIGNWFIENTKWAWLIYGIIIGFWSDDWYCACYAGTVGIVGYVFFYHKEWKNGWFLLACCAHPAYAGCRARTYIYLQNNSLERRLEERWL